MISVVYSFRLFSNDKIRPITLPAINTHQQILISCRARKENRDIPKGNVKEKIILKKLLLLANTSELRLDSNRVSNLGIDFDIKYITNAKQIIPTRGGKSKILAIASNTNRRALRDNKFEKDNFPK